MYVLQALYFLIYDASVSQRSRQTPISAKRLRTVSASFRPGKLTCLYLQFHPLGPHIDSTLDIMTTSHSVLGPRETRDGISLLPTRSCLVSRLVLTRSCILPSWTDLAPISLSERSERKRWRTRFCGYVGTISHAAKYLRRRLRVKRITHTSWKNAS